MHFFAQYWDSPWGNLTYQHLNVLWKMHRLSFSMLGGEPLFFSYSLFIKVIHQMPNPVYMRACIFKVNLNYLLVLENVVHWFVILFTIRVTIVLSYILPLWEFLFIFTRALDYFPHFNLNLIPYPQNFSVSKTKENSGSDIN